jgi:hypothetical protein
MLSTLTLELGTSDTETMLALENMEGVEKYQIFKNKRTDEVLMIIQVRTHGVVVARGHLGSKAEDMVGGDKLISYSPPKAKVKDGPEGHTCRIGTCLYGGGHHIVDIDTRDKKWSNIIKSIGICRGCGTCYKIAQYFSQGKLKEKMRPCTNHEYADLLREKFHKMRKMEPDRYRIESFEQARRMLDETKDDRVLPLGINRLQ